MIVERIASRWPVPPLSNQDRREIWRRKYVLVPFEAQIGATAVHSLPHAYQFNPSELPRRESRTLQNAGTPPASVANPPNSAPATVATAGTFWTRFLAVPSLDWVESWPVIGLSIFLVIASLLLRVEA